MRVEVYLNTNVRNSLVYGWRESDPMRLAFQYDFPQTSKEPMFAFDWAYREFNVDRPGDIGKAYRAAGKRSVSVGDVIIVGGTAHAVADVGWTPVEADRLTIIDTDKEA